MEKEYQELLAKFQCDYNRIAEETFAQTLAENEKVRLFFINENLAEGRPCGSMECAPYYYAGTDHS